MKKLYLILFLAVFCSCSTKDKRPIRTKPVLGCRGNYDCEAGRRCSGSREELFAGMGLCVDAYHPRSEIKNY